MQRHGPPKHRHDGTSPLPLGMDWSPPPRKWSGRDTVWPHDPRSGWSYCVTVPSWTVLPKSRESDPVVFYRVQIGIQSPEGVTATRGVLRRFNDFLKLFGALRKAFPRKNLPPAPPKGLLRLKSNTLLEERRCSLAAWMEKLLSDIDISRSVAVASFLELEAAARSSFQDEKQSITESTLSVNKPVAGSGSLTSDYGSDTVYEASEIGTSSLGRDNGSEPGMDDLSLDQDLTDPIERLVKYGMSNIDEGLFMGQAILEQLEGLPRHKANVGEINKVAKGNNGNASRGPYFSPDSEDSQVIHHARKLSSESVGSEVSSLKGSESSNSGPSNALGDGSLDLFPRGSEVYKNPDILGTELPFPSDVKLVLPLDHRQKMNRLLITMQRRLVTAKTDMEDLISRLNQEIAVKDYLTTKVKDLEVELETTKQRSKENLQQAISIERERYTQMQWDMEELKRKSFEMELKLNSQSKNPDAESTKGSTGQGKDELMQELDATKQQLIDLQKQHQELEAKSKADIKVLVKEVKSLRNSQAEYKQQLNQSLKEKSEAEKLLQQEKQNTKNANTARRKLVNECEVLRSRLQECHVNLLHEDKLVQDSSSLTAAFDLLTLSDSRINLLLSEAQLLGKDDEDGVVSTAETVDFVDDGAKTTDHELREMLRNIFIDNTRLRKEVNSIMHYALKRDTSSDKIDDDQAPSEHFIQNESIER